MSRPMRRLAAPTLLLAVTGCLLIPAGALAQATRTWVSGTGDDANPCSRTAPCKTFFGASTKTAAHGEIDVIDPGGYGGLTITKSLTIDGRGALSSILVSGTNAVIINAPSTAKVTLRNLSINGIGTGLSGIRVLSAGTVRVENTKIFGFTTAGIDNETTSATALLVVQDSSIHDNAGPGILDKPATGGRGRARIRNSSIDDNDDGVVADATDGRTPVTLTKSSIFDSGANSGTGFGVRAIGANAAVRLSGNDISGNLVGLSAASGGQIVSFGDNVVVGNNADGTPTSTIGKT